MKINHNMSANIANRKLLNTDNSVAKSIERLSTGLRINRAADDAAGMAIASKMRSQIMGLDQASQNASDGISVLDTADGALNEVHAMLQRMRELSVQAANETNMPDDVEAIQAEISSLREEIDRISRDTEFNTKTLLDGTLDQRVYPDNRGITRIDISDSVTSNIYTVEITADAEHAVIEGTRRIGGDAVVPTGAAGKVVINGVEVEVKEGETFTEVYDKMREGAERGQVNLLVTNTQGPADGLPENGKYVPVDASQGGYLVFLSDEYGSSYNVHVQCDNTVLADFLGIDLDRQEIGKDVQVGFGRYDEGFGSQATIQTNGNYASISDRNGFKMTFEVIPGTTGEVKMDVTNIGMMTMQIGANENQTVDVRIPEVSSRSLYLDKLDVCKKGGADRAIAALDDAIAKVSEVRSRIGAYQNRMDYTVTSLDATEENMTQALSRIEDVDMAAEMTEYTKYNVLSQAATSVLAQANDIPQQVLQLLQ